MQIIGTRLRVLVEPIARLERVRRFNNIKMKGFSELPLSHLVAVR